MGPQGEQVRANDDGEPSGTAGRPILGQMLSAGVTNCLVVVVRYFGGTKLGVPGLIAAYKEATQEVLSVAEIVERTVDDRITVRFPYIVMNDVMKAVKEEQPQIEEQLFDNLCTMRLRIRRSQSERLVGKLRKVEGAEVEESL